GDGGTLAIGARHRDDTRRGPQQLHALRDFAHAVERQVDAGTVHRLLDAQPVFETAWRAHPMLLDQDSAAAGCGSLIVSTGLRISICSSRAIESRWSRRSMIRSMAPFSIRNSARWK